MINYFEFKLKLSLKTCPFNSTQLTNTIKQILLDAPNLDTENIDIKIEAIALGGENGKRQ